ncbi:HAD family hydrolase [Streptomyces sp. NPDC090442]|uniref:HAD family hydrolase n=1 Tax=Streptomyces sp. NPDC090442 TaxID=3365962 RepID=UPI003823F5BE
MRAHIVWDWNGTLLDDVDVALAATNAAIAEVGLSPLSLGRYRELYTVPVWDFYTKLLGRAPAEEEWAAISKVFSGLYRPGLAACGLADGAGAVLAARQEAGATQSLCSLMPHGDLVPMVRSHGIDGSPHD